MPPCIANATPSQGPRYWNGSLSTPRKTLSTTATHGIESANTMLEAKPSP